MNIQESLLRLRGGLSTLTFLEKEGGESAVRCGVLFEEALGLAGALRREALAPGGSLILQTEGVKNRITALWACWLGGFAPVSSALLSKAEASGALEEMSAAHGGARVLTDIPYIKSLPLALDIDALPRSHAGEIVKMKDGDAALLQYTSGTTDAARCAVLTGKNLYESGLASSVVVRKGVRERYFNWLPLNHIFGIAAQHLVPLVNDFDQYHMATSRFLERPALWAGIISGWRATVSGAAPFALELLQKNRDGFQD
ncbi:MAG: AMP-binding protein, partial [Oscillospiraceae bacterium]|nr:AMP-binding protein [Oscillospiraceae bacterium]